LTAAIARVLDNSELRNAIGAAGQQSVLSFSWDRTAHAYENIYATLLSNNGELA
jgi:glycosyltransferase involved in cell wall biosynthesis